MIARIGIVIICIVASIAVFNIFYVPKQRSYSVEALRQQYLLPPTPSVDHAEFEQLQGPFQTPQEVTEACISCHNLSDEEIMNSSHWNWQRTEYVMGQGVKSIGKANVINNFCIGAQSNEQACAKCHIGFGMTDQDFTFEASRNVDCMVCHDNSDAYLKASAQAGYPDRSVNLQKVAQSVGRPRKENCGACHFFSGGGNNVKHGDLESALLSTSVEVDVHMASNGIDLSCVDCHSAENHKMKGKLYSVSSSNYSRSSCVQCHDAAVHQNEILNTHFAKVSCQACHIPEYAKVNPTKMEWYWSEAGQLKEGEPFHLEDSAGNHTYLSTKGRFAWQSNVVPEYVWFNGTADHYMLGDTIDTIPVQINRLFGSATDKESKIIPVKVHRGNQIYDPVNNYLVQPKLFDTRKGEGAFWSDFDWDAAAKAGMEKIGLDYSGSYGFVETEMYWPVNHMVAPAAKALRCDQCHTRSPNGRLANLAGFYLPGRDVVWVSEFFGKAILYLTLASIVTHGAMRAAGALKRRQNRSKTSL